MSDFLYSGILLVGQSLLGDPPALSEPLAPMNGGERGRGEGNSQESRGTKTAVPLRKPNRSESAINCARQARKVPSVAEEIVWKFLRNGRLGFKFRREYPVLDYRIDFFCAEANLGVEFDGEQHDAVRDSVRDARLADLGIEVMRIPNREFFMLDGEPPRDTFNLILERCEERTGRPGIRFEL